MPKRRNLSVEERAAVESLNKENYSGRVIAKKLKIGNSAAQNILKKTEETGTVKDRPRSGRPSSKTPRQNCFLSHLALSDRLTMSKDIKRAFEDATGSDPSCRTVRKKLLKSGLRECVAARKYQDSQEEETRLVPREEGLDSSAVEEDAFLRRVYF